MKLILPLFFALLLTLANAQDTSPPSSSPLAPVDISAVAGVLNKVLTTYKSMQMYESNGTIISEMDEAGTHVQTTTTFSIKLKKPNLYLITWSQASVPAALPQGGAVWNDGTQPYLYLLMNNSYTKMGDDVSALGGAASISTGASNTIPSLFFPVFTDRAFALSRLQNPTIEKSEMIGSEDCYVLTGSSTISNKETFWISKSSSLILRYEKTLEAPSSTTAPPVVTEEVIEKSLRAMGQPVTEENKKQVRDMMATANGTMKNSDVSGTSTENQMEISNPAFTAQDFQFTPPAGTTLTDSLVSPPSGTNQVPSPPADSGTGNDPDKHP